MSRKMRDLSELGKNRQIEITVLRLREAVRSAGGQKVVAARTDIPLSTFSGYLAGREMKISVASKIAKVCGVSLEWLAGENVERTESDQARNAWPKQPDVLHASACHGLTAIPGYDVELSAGHGISPSYADESISFQISSSLLPEHLKTRAHRLVGFTVRGDSMEPVIFSGDNVVVDLMDKDIFTGGVYALRVGDQLLVKRLALRANGNLSVMSDNPRYPTDEINAEEARQMILDGGSPIGIIGRVVWRGGGLFTE
ncbi:LexA family transcriptional regulator [Komagataeibacter oboediens]|uniref:Helix-turn-helix transcriptional regulator n=1 Tax=Komagataeibacter oboediens TaxID=65958 RepID=A0ABS5SR00_9PROT|nr:S24 family peptidase [Komagataeibacter oboediens]MBL7232089.1 helix-turn-helix transcriptional regulator [Komagataeibacter oboediens]MBT0676634.1 helix-turn-helix transcriptional regulator [Komagataeibacter oboediens]MBT0679929.1 helix-turn-helix transcriptional regulator [Komagataeibacter oboediens]